MGIVGISLLTLLGVFVLVIVTAMVSGGSGKSASPRTYADVASDAEAACKREHPDAPASYCHQLGVLNGATQLCKDKPWECNR